MKFESFARIVGKKPEEEKKPETRIEGIIPPRLQNEEAEKIIREKVDLQSIEDELDKLRVSPYENPIDPFNKKEGVVKAAARLVLELRDRLPHYDTILSDDASGRLVSLLLKKIIDRKKEERGGEKTEMFFLASGRHGSAAIDRSIRKFIGKKKKELGKTLLVTEYIESGKSIEKLTKALEDKHIDFDIGTLSIERLPQHYGNVQFPQHVHYGALGKQGLSFYDQESFGGVTKGETGPHPVKSGFIVQKDVERARKEVAIIADGLENLLS
jgi:hypothetical protein